MRMGTFSTLFTDQTGLAFAVSTASDAAIAVFNLGLARTINVDVSSVTTLAGASQLTDTLAGAQVPVLSGSVAVAMPTFGTMVLTP